MRHNQNGHRNIQSRSGSPSCDRGTSSSAHAPRFTAIRLSSRLALHGRPRHHNGNRWQSTIPDCYRSQNNALRPSIDRVAVGPCHGFHRDLPTVDKSSTRQRNWDRSERRVVDGRQDQSSSRQEYEPQTHQTTRQGQITHFPYLAMSHSRAPRLIMVVDKAKSRLIQPSILPTGSPGPLQLDRSVPRAMHIESRE
jgi:hypothetical protein